MPENHHLAAVLWWSRLGSNQRPFACEARGRTFSQLNCGRAIWNLRMRYPFDSCAPGTVEKAPRGFESRQPPRCGKPLLTSSGVGDGQAATGTHCSRPEWSSATSQTSTPQTPALGSGLPNTGRVRCRMQPHPLPRGLRDQLNPDNNNLALNPGGLTFRDTPPRLGAD